MEDSTGPAESLYVPTGGDAERFVPRDEALPLLHLIEYHGSLSLCEDATGLLVGPKDRRLATAGIYVANLRGVAYYKPANRHADTRPRRPLRLVREPENPHDSFAIAVHDGAGTGPLGYINRQKARAWSKLLLEGVELQAISLRGTAHRRPCDGVTVLAAKPEVVAHLLSRRPDSLPMPVFLR